jgi:hypothetical protein
MHSKRTPVASRRALEAVPSRIIREVSRTNAKGRVTHPNLCPWRDGQRLSRVGAAEDQGADIVSLIDEGLAQLEARLPL